MTLAECAALLDPPVTAEQMRRIFARLPGMERAGTRATGNPGPPEDVYDLAEVMDWHKANLPWLVARGPQPRMVPRSRPGP